MRYETLLLRGSVTLQLHFDDAIIHATSSSIDRVCIELNCDSIIRPWISSPLKSQMMLGLGLPAKMASKRAFIPSLMRTSRISWMNLGDDFCSAHRQTDGQD